jgi:tetratricopeptide (TPR) repeat protein
VAVSSFQKIMMAGFFVLAGVTISYGQQNPQALFDRANQQLESLHYKKAIALYKDLIAQNTVSGALYLNLGISYQRVDSLGKAKYYFLKAAEFDATEDEANQALEHVETQFSRRSAVLPKLPWDIATHWLQNNVGSSTLLALGIILLNIGILFYIAHWFTDWHPRLFNIGGYVIVGLSILLVATGFYTEYVSERYSTAVMVVEKVPVYEKPQSNASLVSQAFEGYTFTVDHYKSNSESGWKYVRMSNGLYGWVPGDKIMIL